MYVLAVMVLAIFVARESSAETVTVENCGRTLTFADPPSRAVSHDMNISEIMFALGLQDRMVGVTGISGWYKMTPEFRRAMGKLPELAPKYPTIETLLAVEPDFFFAGWYYGMKPGGAVTPQTLGEFGVPVYVLSESCVHVMKKRPRASMETLYGDILNIGRIFEREARAQTLVESYRIRISKVEMTVRGKTPPRVFLFDSGEEKPFTAGKHAIPTAIIEAAGGRNVTEDVKMSWGRIGWEPVIERDPEFIIIVGYQDDSWRDRWQFLRYDVTWLCYNFSSLYFEMT